MRCIHQYSLYIHINSIFFCEGATHRPRPTGGTQRARARFLREEPVRATSHVNTMLKQSGSYLIEFEIEDGEHSLRISISTPWDRGVGWGEGDSSTNSSQSVATHIWNLAALVPCKAFPWATRSSNEHFQQPDF